MPQSPHHSTKLNEAYLPFEFHRNPTTNKNFELLFPRTFIMYFIWCLINSILCNIQLFHITNSSFESSPSPPPSMGRSPTPTSLTSAAAYVKPLLPIWITKGDQCNFTLPVIFIIQNIFLKWTKLVIATVTIKKTIYSCYIMNKVKTCGLSISYLVLTHHLQSPLGMIFLKMLNWRNICSRGREFSLK